jgi:hypothetical protein
MAGYVTIKQAPPAPPPPPPDVVLVALLPEPPPMPQLQPITVTSFVLGSFTHVPFDVYVVILVAVAVDFVMLDMFFFSF